MNRVSPVLLAILVSTSALAANVHLKGKSVPTFTDEGTTLSVRTCLAGLGAGDLTVDIDASGIGETECSNPGGNVAPGQDTEVDTSGTLLIPSTQFKNGTVCFTVETDEPTVPDTPTCPNDHWSADVIDVDFSDATLLVYQGGQLVFQFSNDSL